MKSYLKIGFLIGLTTFLASPILAPAAETGTALKMDSLRAEPFADAKTVGNLSKNEIVSILTKKGAWLQVKTKKTRVGCAYSP